MRVRSIVENEDNYKYCQAKKRRDESQTRNYIMEADLSIRFYLEFVCLNKVGMEKNSFVRKRPSSDKHSTCN